MYRILSWIYGNYWAIVETYTPLAYIAVAANKQEDIQFLTNKIADFNYPI